MAAAVDACIWASGQAATGSLEGVPAGGALARRPRTASGGWG
jgi:hypothetical protein